MDLHRPRALDVLSVLGAGADDGPPLGVVVFTTLMGIATLGGAWRFRKGDKRGLTVVLWTRILSILSGLPVFFVDDAPDWAPPVVAAAFVVTAVGVGLCYYGTSTRRPAERGA